MPPRTVTRPAPALQREQALRPQGLSEAPAFSATSAREAGVKRAFQMAAAPEASLRRMLPHVQRLGLLSNRSQPLSCASLYRLLTEPKWIERKVVSRYLFEKVGRNLRKRNRRGKK